MEKVVWSRCIRNDYMYIRESKKLYSAYINGKCVGFFDTREKAIKGITEYFNTKVCKNDSDKL